MASKPRTEFGDPMDDHVPDQDTCKACRSKKRRTPSGIGVCPRCDTCEGRKAEDGGRLIWPDDFRWNNNRSGDAA